MFRFFAYKFHIALFVIFLILNGAYLTTIPGLMGDEAHEGENVYHMLDQKKLEIQGERSYIGAGIDYVRILFVMVFGYTAFALRSITFLASALFFIMSAYLLIRYLGKYQSLIPLIFLTFSPIYITQQRLAWAVTLLPLFAVAMIWLLQSSWRNKFLLAGLVGGLGLANHLLFLPTLVAIIILFYVIRIVYPLLNWGEGAMPSHRQAGEGRFRALLSTWPIIIGFIAGFAMQFAIIQLYPDDQGSQKAIAETFSDRISTFPALFPEIVSGSSYIASYTGRELNPVVMAVITSLFSILAIFALTISKHKKVALIVFIALLIHILVLLRIIDRFSLRYMTVFVLGFWMLSGIGLEAIVVLVRKRSAVVASMLTWLICTALIVWAVFSIAVPYVKTGGSTNLFSLGNRTDSASALVDTRELFACVNGLGPVTSENVHIYNRLEFWSRQYPGVQFVDEDHKKQAQYTIDYRIPGNIKTELPGTICPQIQTFRITERK